jgi:hypothetical protein
MRLFGEGARIALPSPLLLLLLLLLLLKLPLQEDVPSTYLHIVAGRSVLLKGPAQLDRDCGQHISPSHGMLCQHHIPSGWAGISHVDTHLQQRATASITVRQGKESVMSEQANSYAATDPSYYTALPLDAPA